MTPELILLLAGALGLGGLGSASWTRRAQRKHVIRVQTAWVRAGQVVRFGPVGASCLGNRPRRTYTRGIAGALGITDGKLVFDGYRNNNANRSIACARIHHIGLTTLPLLIERASLRKRALTVHYDSPNGWRVIVFLTQTPYEFARELSAESSLPIHDSGNDREDFGPVRATHMHQDIYGEWTAGRQADLYLAPDRLLFNWRDAIPLAQVRQLDILAQGGWHTINPFATGVLRIEHIAPDGDIQTTGFAIRHAQQWAEAIAHRMQAALIIRSGRKKKAE